MSAAIESLPEIARRRLTLLTHRVRSMPILVLMPHSRCNCRCLMCDIWKANKDQREISAEELGSHLESLRALRVRWVVLSGGEALMHSNLWKLTELLRSLDLRLTLLSTGLLLERDADRVVDHCDDVIVSLDGSPDVHDQIRNIPRAYERLAAGVRALRSRNPSYRVTARCVLQRGNFRDLEKIIETATELELQQISFLAVDTWSSAFNRNEPWNEDRATTVALDPSETQELAEIVERVVVHHRTDFENGFIAESPDRMRGLVRHFEGLSGAGEFDRRRCNAPWVSTVVEADGSVRPCFFHPSLGNLEEAPLAEIVNSEEAIAFRRQLDVGADPICRRCVCTLHLPPHLSPTASIEPSGSEIRREEARA